MATITGLELINRVLLYRRQPTIAAYSATDPEHVVTLNALNMAKEDILGTRRWEFDLRHDGQLMTKATASSRSLSPTFTGSADATTASLSIPTTTADDEVVGEWVLRIVPTGDTDYGDTAFRATYGVGSGDTATVGLSFPLPKAFSATACDLVYAEYLLPDTVREVVRASFDQNELSLEQLDPTVEFDECIPSPHLESGRPRIFNVGGYDRETYTSGAPTVPKLRAIIWPVPDDEYLLSYSYYYAHADLTGGTSTWDGIPSAVMNDIIWQAVSLTKMALDGDYAAAHFSDMAQNGATAKHMAYSGSSARRHTVKSWDTGRIGRQEGFPGKVIG